MRPHTVRVSPAAELEAEQLVVCFVQVTALSPADKAGAVVPIDRPPLPVGVKVQAAGPKAQGAYGLAQDVFEPRHGRKRPGAVQELGSGLGP